MKSKSPRRKSDASKVWRHWPVLLALVALFALSWNFLGGGWHSAASAEWDWDFYWAGREMVRRIWAAGGNLSPWIPHFCGGFPILDSTEIPLLSPFLIFWQKLGPVPGSKWEFVITLGIGLVGMYRAIGALAPASPRWLRACGALHFATCGFLLLHLNAGHFSFAAFALLSWIAFGFLAERVEPIALALAAGPILGSNNYFMHAILFTVAAGITNPKWLRLTAKAGAWAVLLSAPVIIHSITGYGEARFLKFSAFNHHELPQSIESLFDLMTTAGTNIWACDVDCYWEYGNYVGLVALALGLIGLAKGAYSDWRMRPWVFVGLIFFLIALGPVSKFAPFSLFLYLPLLNRLEVNTRFLMGFTTVLFLGWSWFLGVELQKTRWSRVIAGVLAIVSLLPSLQYAHKLFDLPGLGKPLADLREKPADMQLIHGVRDFRSGRYEALTSQTGTDYCHVSSSRGWYDGKIQVGKGPILIAPPETSAHFDDRYWMLDWNPTPESLRQAGPLVWLLNQNYSNEMVVDPLSSPGLPIKVSSEDALVKFEIDDRTLLKPGKQIFRLRIEPPWSLIASFGILLISWAIFLARWIFDKPKRPA